MALKIKLPWSEGGKTGWPLLVRVALAAVAAVGVVFVAVAAYYYLHYRTIVDARLNGPIFATTAKIYAAPREVRPGQRMTAHLIGEELRLAGYTPDGASVSSPLGTYAEAPGEITVRPGAPSIYATRYSLRSGL